MRYSHSGNQNHWKTSNLAKFWPRAHNGVSEGKFENFEKQSSTCNYRSIFESRCQVLYHLGIIWSTWSGNLGPTADGVIWAVNRLLLQLRSKSHHQTLWEGNGFCRNILILGGFGVDFLKFSLWLKWRKYNFYLGPSPNQQDDDSRGG